MQVRHKNTAKHARAKLTLSFLLVGVLAGSTGLAAESSEDQAVVVQEEGTMVTFAGGMAKSTGSIKVRINGPSGQSILEKRASNGLVDWAPDANAPDGVYRYDVWYTDSHSQKESDVKSVTEGSGKASTENVIYKSGILLLENGFFVSPELKTKEYLESSSLAPKPGFFETLVGTTLSWFISDAHAVNTITDKVESETTFPDFWLSSTNDQTENPDLGGPAFELGLGGSLPPYDFELENAAGTSQFIVQQDAPANSIYIESTGHIGLGTATPDEELHIVDSAEPGIRLEDSSNGEEWQIIQTNNGGLEFDSEGTTFADNVLRLFPTGEVGLGIGTFSTADAPLHVQRSDDTAQILVEDTATAASQIMFKLRDAGAPRFNMENTADGYQWNFNAFSSGFTIGLAGTGGSELVVGDNGSFTVGPGGTANFQVDANGNVFVEGSLVHSSSREAKKAITPIDGEVVLSKLERLDLAEWSYKDSENGDRHLSPMAEDFHAAFGLGPDNKHVAPSDLAGVALAAAKELKNNNEALKAENRELRARLERIELKLGLKKE